MAEERRVREFRVGYHLLLDIVNAYRLENACLLVPKFRDLPEGYRVVNMREDWLCRTFNFLIEHPSFDPVPEGQPAPAQNGLLDVGWVAVRVSKSEMEADPEFVVVEGGD